MAILFTPILSNSVETSFAFDKSLRSPPMMLFINSAGRVNMSIPDCKSLVFFVRARFISLKKDNRVESDRNLLHSLEMLRVLLAPLVEVDKGTT